MVSGSLPPWSPLADLEPTGKAISAVVLLAIIWAVAGCASDPPAATTNRLITPYESAGAGAAAPNRMLTSTEQTRVRASFATIATGHVAVNPPTPAPLGVRWQDVELAIGAACDDVEMAVTRKTRHEWGWEFELRTIEDFPGTLVVKRTDHPRVYEASATIGRFGDRTARAEALLAAFDKQMRAFGKKRSLEVE